MSPGRNLGLNEYRCPHFGQKPSDRPAVPFLVRPTGSPSIGQNRLLSCTTGSSSTATTGSCSGMGGMSTKPAPSRFRRDELVFLVDLWRIARLVAPAAEVSADVRYGPVGNGEGDCRGDGEDAGGDGGAGGS